MSDVSSEAGARSETDATDAAAPELRARIEELDAQLELLADENRRLRAAYAAARRTTYRRTAAGLIGVGLLCGTAGLVVPAGANVLFALAGTGLFGGVLTYLVTPERFISADIGERVYAALAESYAGLVTELGLSDRRVYMPTGGSVEADGSGTAVRLFVPQRSSMPLPDPDRLRETLIVAEESDQSHGLATEPTGARIFAAFETAATAPVAADPRELVAQLEEAVVADFELARSVESDIDPERRRATIRIEDPVYGPGDRFDHPVVSFFAVGLAAAVDEPVEAVHTATDPLTVTYRWGREPIASNDPTR